MVYLSCFVLFVFHIIFHFLTKFSFIHVYFLFSFSLVVIMTKGPRWFFSVTKLALLYISMPKLVISALWTQGKRNSSYIFPVVASKWLVKTNRTPHWNRGTQLSPWAPSMLPSSPSMFDLTQLLFFFVRIHYIFKTPSPTIGVHVWRPPTLTVPNHGARATEQEGYYSVFGKERKNLRGEERENAGSWIIEQITFV